jgi:hypothetical protein
MTEAVHGKPPAPLVTRAVQLLGLAAVAFGGYAISTGPGCQELDCLAWFLGALLAGWGVCALLAGIRGPVGLVFFVVALVLGLAVSWANPFLGLIVLLVVSLLMNASKDRLAPYYRRRAKAGAAS